MTQDPDNRKFYRGRVFMVQIDERPSCDFAAILFGVVHKLGRDANKRQHFSRCERNRQLEGVTQGADIPDPTKFLPKCRYVADFYR